MKDGKNKEKYSQIVVVVKAPKSDQESLFQNTRSQKLLGWIFWSFFGSQSSVKWATKQCPVQPME